TVNQVGALATSFDGGGAVLLSAAGPLTFAVATTGASVSATATEAVTPAAGVDNVTVNSGVTVQATAGDVTFHAGDDISVSNTANVTATGNVLLASGVDDNDGEGAMELDGTLSAGAGGRVELDVGAAQGATQASTGAITGGSLLLLGTGTGGSF